MAYFPDGTNLAIYSRDVSVAVYNFLTKKGYFMMFLGENQLFLEWRCLHLEI
jgi:hypothetical protein